MSLKYAATNPGHSYGSSSARAARCEASRKLTRTIASTGVMSSIYKALVAFARQPRPPALPGVEDESQCEFLEYVLLRVCELSDPTSTHRVRKRGLRLMNSPLRCVQLARVRCKFVAGLTQSFTTLTILILFHSFLCAPPHRFRR